MYDLAMDATSLADRLAVMRDAVEAASGFRDRLHEASGDTLGELVTLADTFASMGAQVRAAVVAEAVRRGEVEFAGEHGARCVFRRGRAHLLCYDLRASAYVPVVGSRPLPP